MSSPSRQVGNRRLPPLPSGSRHSPSNVRASSGGHGSSPVSGKAVKGHASNRSSNNHGGHISQIDLTANFGDGPFRPALVQGKAITNGGHGKVYMSAFVLVRHIMHVPFLLDVLCFPMSYFSFISSVVYTD